jgi:cytochrome c oxidase assembly protein subunit 15
MKITSIIAAGAVIGQITLGAIVIVERLHSILVTGHLGLGLVLFSMVLMTTVYAWKIKGQQQDRAELEASRRRQKQQPTA